MNVSHSKPTRLIDAYGRVHTSMRISVTDRCNIRCFYCMPADGIRFRPRHELLSFEEITRIVKLLGQVGIDQVRITGGEPLVRQDLPQLVRLLHQLGSLRDIALTTNAMLLEQQAADLADAGLQRLNISLDTLNEDTFRKITRRDGLDQVLKGIEAAQRIGFQSIRLNALAIANLTEAEVVPLVQFARQQQLHLRFIEFMPLDAQQAWNRDDVLSGETLREIISRQVAPLQPMKRTNPSQPAVDYEFVDGSGQVGFINPVTQPFCQSCNRLRLTAEGQIRNCLFSTTEWDVRDLLRNGASDEEILAQFVAAVTAKKAGHGIDDPTFHRPERAMYQIGG